MTSHQWRIIGTLTGSAAVWKGAVEPISGRILSSRDEDVATSTIGSDANSPPPERSRQRPAMMAHARGRHHRAGNDRAAGGARTDATTGRGRRRHRVLRDLRPRRERL